MSLSIPRALARLSPALLPALALAGAGTLLVPAKDSYGFSKIGGSLGANTQRDFRILNNFADGAANNNTADEPNYPGWDGADVAIWKAASEWASRPHGDGGDDSTQPNIGDGNTNFDFFFAGAATAAGNSNQNIASVLTSCGGGGTLAYVLSPINDGWTLKYCDEWTWADGPGTIGGSQFDIQGVGTHELGHSLGLGHSSTNAATMFGSIGSGSVATRSIHSDDQAGVQCIYGTLSGSKARITGINVDLMADTVTITGANFAGSGNEAWFTRAAATTPSSTPELRVTGLSSSGGGTQIVVSIPAGAGSGDVAVKVPGTGHETLSNSWPLDLMNGGSSGPLTLTGIVPSVVDSLIPGTAETVTLTGTGFDATVSVSVNLVPLPASSFTVVNDTTITLDMPQVSALGALTILVQKGAEFAADLITVNAPSGPVLQAGNGDPANTVAGSVDITMAGPVGQLQYLMYSLSNVPSVFLPYAQLDIGNNFSDLNLIASYVMPASSWQTVTLPLNPSFLLVYTQTMTLAQGLPAADSNVSSFLINF